MILFKLGFKPIYGNDGFLKRTLEINQRTDKNADLVFPGDILKFNMSVSHNGNTCHSISPEGEIILTYETDCHKLMANNSNKSLDYIQRKYNSAEEVVEPVSAEKNNPAQPIPEQTKPAVPVTYSEFTLGVEAGYSALFGYDNSDGTKGELLSKFAPGYYFNWEQFWSEKLSTNLGSRGTPFNVEDTADGKIILGKENFLFQLNFGADYKIHPKWKLSFEGSFGDTPLYRGVATNTYKVDLVNRMTAGGKLEFEFLKHGPLSLSTFGQFGIVKYGKDSFYNAEDGSYYGYGFNIEHRRKTYGLIGSLGYEQEETSVRGVDFTYENISLILGVVWSWSE